jgi:hypothetical protein
MKMFLIILLALILRILAFSQGVEIMDKERVKQSKIKAQTLFEYDYVKGKPEAKGTKSRVTHFDEQGNRDEETNFKSSGSVHYTMSFKYDGTGNKTEFAKYSGDDKKLNYKQNAKFDTKGNKLMETGFNGVQDFKIVYNYNSKLGKLAEVNYFLDKVLDEKRLYTYTGSAAEIKVLDGTGGIKFTQKNTYSPTGKIIEEVRIEPDKTTSRKVVYTYDKNDNLTSETKFINGKQVGKITRIYNDKGILTEVYQENADSKKFLTNKYTYNDKGWLVEELSRSESNKDFSKNVYTYNNAGICTTIDSYYATFKQQVLSVFAYDYY